MPMDILIRIWAMNVVDVMGWLAEFILRQFCTMDAEKANRHESIKVNYT